MRIELALDDDRIFEPGRRVILMAGGAERDAHIEYFRRQHGRCVIKFGGIDSISDALQWIGAEIRIPSNEVSPKEGWFYTFQLRGCRVFDAAGEYIGTVTDVLGSEGAEILRVALDDEETLIPFAHSYLKSVDLAQKRIEVELPDGLRGLNK